MSDFLFTARPRPPGELARILARFPALPLAESAEPTGAPGSLAVCLPPHESQALVCSRDHTTLLLGSPVVRLPGLPPAPVTVGRRRELLHLALASPDFSPGDVLDGAFAALVLGHEQGGVRAITDRFCFISLFRARDADGGLVLGSHADAVARAAGRADALDMVAAADLAANFTSTFPFTLYQGVVQLEPGSVHELGRDGRVPRVSCYWQPLERDRFGSPAEATATLRQALRESVAASCQGSERVGVLLSGGEDSRAVLAAVPAHTPVTACTYAGWESREVRVARAVARAYGAELQVGLRAPDHYQANFRQAAALIGSQHLFADAHGLGLSDRLGLGRLPLVLGGFSADSLLKAEYSPRQAAKRFRSPRLPLLREELLRAVDERRAAFRQRLRALRPDSADEWSVLWPFCMRKHGGYADANRRLFRIHEAFHATAVLDVAAAVPADWKRHRRLFRGAFRPLFRRSRLVPHARRHFPYYGRLGNLLLLPGLLVARGLRDLARGELGAEHGPWPLWSSLMDSPVMVALERSRLSSDSPLAELFDVPPERAVAGLAAWPALRRLRLLQLACLAREP